MSMDDEIKRVVDSAPPLSDAQIEKLKQILEAARIERLAREQRQQNPEATP